MEDEVGYHVSNSYCPVLVLGHKDVSTKHTHVHLTSQINLILPTVYLNRA